MLQRAHVPGRRVRQAWSRVPPTVQDVSAAGVVGAVCLVLLRLEPENALNGVTRSVDVWGTLLVLGATLPAAVADVLRTQRAAHDAAVEQASRNLTLRTSELHRAVAEEHMQIARDVHDHRPDALHLLVRDLGRGAGRRRTSGGHGLLGMRERAVLIGGALHAGPEGGGWEVRAVLPLAA